MRTRIAVAALVLAGTAACAPPPETTTPGPMAMTSSKPPAPPPMTTAPPPPPCDIPAGACVSRADGLAWLLRDGKVTFGPVDAEPGGAGEPTPVGTFRVAWKDRVHRSSEFGTDMPNSVFFAAGGIAFHAGPLTTPSHGCVHLSDADSATFFDALAVGDAVQITA